MPKGSITKVYEQAVLCGRERFNFAKVEPEYPRFEKE
jgi:hypothetical protein